ncbi:GntR family transcriptional regulator [Metabacillus halosaccharovorans]|uniref:GntR family transcriptional regulator n=1 Tax=Metabacillus halosaccharovorans TaxID=930124 RepID=UPI00203B4138|nr:GntR family transcriptional regulator [Metabacillus halosaccharovorans]MCM3443187.1 GntR family transcriptional regulator [Metabacillus halosaccharovorans]
MKPLYIRIKEQLASNIQAGKWKSGDRLPPEVVLATEFEVSRETVRSAIRLLEEEGKVYVRHGVGTFIVNPLPQTPNSLEKLMSVTSMITHAGLEDGEKREKIKVIKPIPEWRNLLQLTSDENVVIHERIRTADSEPVVFSKNILAQKLVNEKMIHKGSIGSLFNFLKEECKIDIAKATTEIVVPLHTDRNCQKLLIHPETTVLLLKQLHYDYQNRPVLYSLDYFRNDIFKFTVNRTI